MFEIGHRIFEKAAQNLSRADGLRYINPSVSSLMESSCCGYHRASYVLAVIFEVGLGVPVDSAQVRFGCFKRELVPKDYLKRIVAIVAGCAFNLLTCAHGGERIILCVVPPHRSPD